MLTPRKMQIATLIRQSKQVSSYNNVIFLLQVQTLKGPPLGRGQNVKIFAFHGHKLTFGEHYIYNCNFLQLQDMELHTDVVVSERLTEKERQIEEGYITLIQEMKSESESEQQRLQQKISMDILFYYFPDVTVRDITWVGSGQVTCPSDFKLPTQITSHIFSERHPAMYNFPKCNVSMQY